jgi:hypothetical protein
MVQCSVSSGYELIRSLTVEKVMLRCLVLVLVMVGCGAEEEHAKQVISGEGQQGFQECPIAPVESPLDRAVLQTGTLPIEGQCLAQP